jgi:transcriptional regulator with XRE-family HTH domain
MYQSQITSIVIRLKKAKNNNPELTIQRIADETGVSKSTVTRVFADDSENQSFRYESLKALSFYLLGTDGLDEEIDTDEMQMRLSQLKEKYEAKLEKERARSRVSIDFLKEQVKKKDERIDYLMKVNEELMNRIFVAGSGSLKK